MPSKPHSRYLDDPLFSFANSTMALLNTTFFNHELAMALNHAYGLKLRRIDDCPLGDSDLPCFIFHDPSTRLTFVVLDRPTAAPITTPFENYDKLLIATGSSPVKLPLPGMDLPGVMDSDLILDNREPLESLTIIGGGVIGMEFACLYASLGTRVTVIEALDRILATLDKEFGQNLKMILKKQDVDIHTSAMLKGIREEKDENEKRTLVCTYEEKGKTQEASSEKVLVAVGRRALTQGLFEGLENIPAIRRTQS